MLYKAGVIRIGGSVTSLERARAFLSSKAKKTALIILPLAAAAVQAHAGTITFNFASGAGSFSTSGGVVTPASSGLFATLFPTGISLYGDAVFTVTSSGGVGGGGPCTDACAGFFTFNTGSGTFPVDSLPVTYDFTLQASNGDPLNWNLNTCILTTGFTCNSASGVTPSGGGVTPIIGNFNVSGLSGQVLQDWYVDLQVDFASNATFNTGDTITLGIPQGSSIDLGPLNQTPEPGTGWLLASAGVAFACFRRKLFGR
jgi:hypothetical protein